MRVGLVGPDLEGKVRPDWSVVDALLTSGVNVAQAVGFNFVCSEVKSSLSLELWSSSASVTAPRFRGHSE